MSLLRKLESFFSMRSRRAPSTAGFTLVELMVSIAIFGIMTALVVAKYGTFNQSVLLTDLAYDVALTLRTAQTYGLSVTRTGEQNDVDAFQYAYGIHFSKQTNSNKEFILYTVQASDSSPEYRYTSGGGIEVSRFLLKRGATISNLEVCLSGVSCTEVNQLDVAFKRPDPSARICGNSGQCDAFSAIITIQATDDSTRTVIVRENGQISVSN